MKVHLLVCDIFQPELERVLEQIKTERSFTCEIALTYLPASLHNDFNHLIDSVRLALDTIAADRIILFYGLRCHPGFDKLLKNSSLISFPQSNCIELILGDRIKEINRAARTFYLTTGWLLKWRDLLEPIIGTDKPAFRKSFGRYIEKTLYIDTGVCKIDEEKIHEFFEYTRVPIEIEQVGLTIFKNNVVAAIRAAVENQVARK